MYNSRFITSIEFWPNKVVAYAPQEYTDSAAELVKLRREAKVNGNFFVEPEAGLEVAERKIGAFFF